MCLAVVAALGCTVDDREIRAFGGRSDGGGSVHPSCEPEPEGGGCGRVTVTGATVTLGDPGARRAGPVQPRITVSGFEIDRYEVTVARFRRYWNAGHPGVQGQWVVYRGGRNLPWALGVSEPGKTSEIRQCTWSDTVGQMESHPVNCVDWFTAQAFCVWDGGRLPTEAEWELAARGTDGRVFPWGDEMPDERLCWGGVEHGQEGTCDETDVRFVPGASPFGAVHMSGNVWEWTADSYGDYGDSDCWQGSPQTDPICSADSEAARTVRGGAWHYTDLEDLRAAARGGVSPTTRDTYGIGFRCVY